MKKLGFILGFLASVSLSIGVVFKLLHLPSANEFFMVGYLSLLLIFIPLYGYYSYKKAQTTFENRLIAIGIAAAVIEGLAGLLKLFQIQGADIVLLFGAAIFIVGFLPLFFLNMYKKVNS